MTTRMMCQWRQATKLLMRKKKVNLTKFANSIVATLFYVVLRMAFVESGNSAESEDYLVDQLAVANSTWIFTAAW